MVLIENFRVLSCNHDNLDRYHGYKQVQVILMIQILFTVSFVLITSRSSIKISALFATIQVKSKSSQVKSSQVKSSQVKSSQVKSSQVKVSSKSKSKSSQ